MSFDKGSYFSQPIFIPGNAAECLALLRAFQAWRRFDGEIDEEGPAMPHPKSIGFAIDMAIRLIEERGELLAAAEVIEINSDEVMDFDDCTAMLVPIDDYHKLMEAIATVKGSQ